MSHTQFLFLITLIAGIGVNARADHPNEGTVAIAQLISEAEKNNLEIKEAEEKKNSAADFIKSKYGRFAPKLSVEGGPQSSTFDGEKSNGTALYGKAEWNIYGGGTDAADLELAKVEYEIQKQKLITLKNKIKNDVLKLYYEMQFLLESISLNQKALDLNSQQVKIAKAKNISGFTTSSDVLEFELRNSTLQSDLVLLTQQLDQKSRELDVLLAKTDESVPISVKGHLERDPTRFNRDDLIAKAQKNNDQLLKLNLEIKQTETEKQQARSQLLPKVDLEAKYGKLSTEEKVFDNNDNYSVGLKVRIPLFSGLEDFHASKSMNSKLKASQLSMQQKNLALISEIDTSLDEMKALNTRLDLEEKNLELSEKYYKLTLDEYKRGVKNSPDMVGASERILEARIRNLEYRRNLKLTKIKIQSLVGEF